MTAPHIVAIGGGLRAESSTGRALSLALRLAEARGARTTLLTGDDINFSHYEPEQALADPAVGRFIEALRSADGVIVGSPGYHGTLSGLVKNALDHVELMSRDERAYFDQRPVGTIAVAAGWQAAVSTLGALRTIVHALRGWPTPLGIAINSTDGPGAIDAAEKQIAMMVDQMLYFLRER